MGAMGVPPVAGARRERKVVTVLFADLVGFTARAEQMDPEDVAAELGRYQAHVSEVLARYDGTLEKFIGDAAMAVLGAPIAHEDDPERAVRAALAIRDWAREQDDKVRIGVNTGEALVTVDARADAGQTLVAGDVVNTAARLQAAAPVNGVLVGETTQRATAAAIQYREAEPVEAKGKAQPVAAWVALEARSRLGVELEREPLTALVGRERELGLLRGAFERAREEREPQLVTLVGVPGIGKSRLVYELFESAEADSELITWRQGRCLSYGDGVTFWALGEIVKAHLGILESDPREEVERKLREVVRDPRLEPHLRPLVGVGTAELGGSDRRSEAFAAWREFFEALAEDGPLVLAIEDVHWGDDDLLDFVDHLVDWARGVPILVVATARPELLERRPAWGGGKSNALTISLSPLSEDETARLIGAVVDQPVMPAETQSELLARAGGNPLYAEQYARILLERGELADLPETVQGIVAARLDLLEPEQKALLQDAAVLGRTFWTGGLATVAALDREAVEDRLHGLERRAFVRRERRTTVAEETQFAFLHVLVRDVAYGQLPRAERAGRHRRTAEWIESLGRPEDHAEMLAHHYLSALELTRASGVEDEALVARAGIAVRDAGDRALALNAFPAVVRFYTQALELSRADDPERPEFLFRLGRALHQTMDPQADEVLENAVSELVAAGHAERAAEARTFLSELWWSRGQGVLALEQIERALGLVGDGDSEARVRVLARLSRRQMLADENEEAISTGREALAIAERLGLDELRADLLNSIGPARVQIGDAGGMADLETSVEIAVALDSPIAAVSYNNLGAVYLYSGDVRRDQQLREESMRVGERFGDSRTLRFGRAVLLEHSYYGGRWEETMRGADAFLAECEAGAPHYLEPTARLVRALISLACDDRETASRETLHAERISRESNDPQMVTPSLAVRLRMELEAGSLDQAGAIAAELLEQPRRVEWMPPGTELAWAAQSLGIEDAARQWIKTIATESKWNDAALLILDGEFGRAADVFAEIGSLPDAARALLGAGDPESLGKALDFFRSVGATRYVREAESLLTASA
jgi:class 3 adenylate cyclase/tetratricopeptide (TPR) repeat protein